MDPVTEPVSPPQLVARAAPWEPLWQTRRTRPVNWFVELVDTGTRPAQAVARMTPEEALLTGDSLRRAAQEAIANRAADSAAEAQS